MFIWASPFESGDEDAAPRVMDEVCCNGEDLVGSALLDAPYMCFDPLR